MSFEDPEFGPNDYSIYGENPSKRISIDYQWKRLEEILGLFSRLFSDEMVSNDIIQGRLGNCWIAAALISLIEHQPLKIWEMFDHDENNQRQGKHIIRLYESGELIRVVLDSFVPCRIGTNAPIFGKSNWIDQWWPLLEKAFAKLYGSYLALDAGYSHEAFMDLTGLPSFKLDINKDEADMFKLKLIDFSEKQFPMVASTPDKIDINKGIKPNHSYTILRTVQAGDYFLINLRNPSGNNQWIGDFSERSWLWTQSIKSQIQRVWPHFNLKDGSFWMKYEDFLVYFDTLYVCNVELKKEKREKNAFTKVEGIGSCANWCYMITVLEETQVVIGIHQEDERNFGVKDCRKYLDLGFAVLRYDGQDYISHCVSKQTVLSRDLQMDLTLPPGKYLVVPISSGTSLTRPKNSWKKYFPLITERLKLHPLFQSTIKDFYRKTNIHMKEAVDYKEFMSLYREFDKDLTNSYYYNSQNHLKIEKTISKLFYTVFWQLLWWNLCPFLLQLKDFKTKFYKLIIFLSIRFFIYN